LHKGSELKSELSELRGKNELSELGKSELSELGEKRIERIERKSELSELRGKAN